MRSIFLRYHGTFLASLIDNSTKPLTISRAKHEDNHLYVLNSNLGLYITYSTKRLSPWVFTFQPKHVEAMRDHFNNYNKSFLILVCGFETTAVLNRAEAEILLPFTAPSNSSISIRTGHDKKLAASGTCGELKSKLSKTRTYARLVDEL